MCYLEFTVELTLPKEITTASSGEITTIEVRTKFEHDVDWIIQGATEESKVIDISQYRCYLYQKYIFAVL